MNYAKLILANYDANISKIDIKPKNQYTKISLSSTMYHEKTDKKEAVKIVFLDVAAIDFRINYFDETTGIEAFGLYEITDKNLLKNWQKTLLLAEKRFSCLKKTIITMKMMSMIC